MSFNKETEMYEGYIYLITNTINNKHYVGQTRRTVNVRWKQHCQYSNHTNKNSAIDRAIGKYGKDNFTVKELKFFEYPSLDMLHNALNNAEIYYIDLYKTLTTQNGYNISAGGSKRNYIEKPVDLYDLDGNLIKTFRSAVDASSYLGVTPTNIMKCCNGSIVNVAKHVCRYKDQGFDLYRTSTLITESKKQYENRPILQYTKDGNFIREYPSINEAVSINGFNKSRCLFDCCIGTYKSSYGYLWKFKDDKTKIEPYLDPRSLLKRPLNQYDVNNNYIQTFYDAPALRKYLCVKDYSSAINRCLNKKKKTYLGYQWFYADDPNQPDKSKIIAA